MQQMSLPTKFRRYWPQHDYPENTVLDRPKGYNGNWDSEVPESRDRMKLYETKISLHHHTLHYKQDAALSVVASGVGLVCFGKSAFAWYKKTNATTTVTGILALGGGLMYGWFAKYNLQEVRSLEQRAPGLQSLPPVSVSP